jgi:hypothetical protein
MAEVTTKSRTLYIRLKVFPLFSLKSIVWKIPIQN